jgi:uncharacterized protein (TIGR02270 family)
LDSHLESTLLERHLDEAGFLWAQREAAVQGTNHDLDSLVDLDGRLEAHLDGLRLGGAAAWGLCRRALENEEAGTVFAAGALALSRGDLPGFATVLELASTRVSLGDALVGALAWVPIEDARPALARLLSPALPPELRRIGLAAFAARRIDPGAPLGRDLADADPALRATALRAAGALGDRARRDAVKGGLESDDPACRAAAIWAGVLLGDIAAARLLPEVAFDDRSAEPGSCELCALTEDIGVAGRDLAKLPPRAAVRFAAASGDVRHLPWLVARLRDRELARPAGAAIAMITGADLGHPPLLGKRPAEESGPNDDAADVRVAPDPDEDLPWPAPDAVERWLTKQFHANGHGRLLCGAEHADAWLEKVLVSGRQPERAVAALALKLRRPERPLFSVRAPAFRQARALATLTSAGSGTS